MTYHSSKLKRNKHFIEHDDYLSSKFVVAAKLTITSIWFHSSSLKPESFKPNSSREMSPGTTATFSEIKEDRFVPHFSFRIRNKSFSMIYK
jgi:hypothetical protein